MRLCHEYLFGAGRRVRDDGFRTLESVSKVDLIEIPSAVSEQSFNRHHGAVTDCSQVYKSAVILLYHENI